MKSLLSFSVLSLYALVASAQLNTGSWLTGGNLKFDATKSDETSTKNSEFRFNPQTFYTFNDHWGFGGGLNFNYSNEKTTNPTSETKTMTSTYGISPGVRYYESISKSVSCYAQGNLFYDFGSTKITDIIGGNSTESKSNISEYGAYVTPGIMWNPKSNLFLDFNYGSLRYSSQTTKPEDSDTKYKDSEFKLSVNPFCICVGMYYAFGNGIKAE